MITILRNGKEMTDKQMQNYIGKICNTHLIVKLFDAGFTNGQIAEISGLKDSIIEKTLKPFIKDNDKKWKR